MKDLSSFFTRIKNLYDKEVGNTSLIIDIFKNTAGVTLSTKQISLKEGILSIQANSAIKSQIFIRKEKLLQAFTEAVPQSHIRDIR